MKHQESTQRDIPESLIHAHLSVERDLASTILAGLERQKEDLGPIAEELIDLLHQLGVDEPPLTALNPSSE